MLSSVVTYDDVEEALLAINIGWRHYRVDRYSVTVPMVRRNCRLYNVF